MPGSAIEVPLRKYPVNARFGTPRPQLSTGFCTKRQRLTFRAESNSLDRPYKHPLGLF